jgi:hypothetical protein
MMEHTFHHVDGRSALRLLWRAVESWLFSVVAGFLLIVIRQNILPPPVDPGIVDRLDAVTLAAVVIATAMVFIREARDPLSYLECLLVGAVWVALSVLGHHLYSLWIHERYVMQFFVAVLLGDSTADRSWVWSMTFAVQLGAPMVLRLLRADRSWH